MNNYFGVLSTVLVSAVLGVTASVNAELYRGDAFLYGDNIEIGIGPDGAFGSDAKSPQGQSQNSYLGLITFPTGSDNAYNGDFVVQSGPADEEGWSVGFDGKKYSNNNATAAEVSGQLLDFKSAEKTQSVSWAGMVDGLNIKQTYRIYTSGTAIIIDVTLTNTTDSEMKEVYYMRTLNPQNNAEFNYQSATKYDTVNTILYQGTDGKGGSAVSAMQPEKAGEYAESILTLSGYGSNSRVTFGGAHNRDPVEVYTGEGLLKQVGTSTGDDSISIAFKFPRILPGESVMFRAGYQLTDAPIATIDLDEDDSSGLAGNGFTQDYILGKNPKKITDTDIKINANEWSQLDEAIVTLANPVSGDKLELVGTLPASISIDTDATTEANIVLTGTASIADYKTALTQIQFSNNNTHASSDTREIIVQVVDENATPSASAISNISIITPVELDNPKIAGDDVVNKTEESSVIFSGHAAEKANLLIEFTDKNGKKLSPAKMIVADDDGNWNINSDAADLSSLSDGEITILVTATDKNGKVSSLSKKIVKDTNIILTNITPEDMTVVSNTAPLYTGKTDPNADVTLKILPDGKVYSTKADANGDWSIQLDKMPMDVTTSVEITAKDEYDNQISSSALKFITPKLPVAITDLDEDDQGIAKSTTPTLKGTSEPDTSISINMPTGGSDIVCNTKTDAEGNWVCKLPVSPSGGPYTVTATTTDGNSNTNTTSKQITIPELPLIIDSPVNDAVVSGDKPVVSGTSQPGTHIKVTNSNGTSCTAVTDDTNHWHCQLPSLSFDHDYTVTVQTTDSIGNSTSKAVNISTSKLPLSVITPIDNSTTEDTTPTFTGTTTPGTKVTVSFPAGQECTATADNEGRWSCEVTKLPVGGPYEATIKAIDTDGNETTSTRSIKVPAIALVIISPFKGDTLTTNDVTVTGSSDPETPITVLGPDGESCKTVSDTDGKWGCLLKDLQSGQAKPITVISGEESDSKKVALITVDIENSTEEVKTVLTGGAGSSSPLFLLFLFGLTLLRKVSIKEQN